jgi:hypothetical protein
MYVYNSYDAFLQSKAKCGIFKSDRFIKLDNWDYFLIKDTYVYYKHSKSHDVTFIVQGLPKEDTFVKLVCSLLRFGYVQLSTWDRSSMNVEDVTHFIKQNGIENGQNIYLQVYSTLSGLNKCSTPYAIKVRADEYYDDFALFIANMKTYSDKITTHTMFFRTLGQYPYHISDHIIAGKTSNVLKMFNSAKQMLEEKQKLPKIPRMLQHCPEQWLTVAYMKCFYTDDELLDNIPEKMITHFNVVPLGIFKDFILTYSMNNKRSYIKGTEDLRNHSHAFSIINISKYA